MVKIERVVIITTSDDKLGDTDQRTGVWLEGAAAPAYFLLERLEDVAAPYYFFLQKGYAVEIASIRGGIVPIEPKSLTRPMKHFTRKFLNDEAAQDLLYNTKSIVYINGTEQDAYYVAGGRGILWDGSINDELAVLLGTAYGAGKVIGAVGHASATLLRVVDPKGKKIVAGKQVTGISNEEMDVQEVVQGLVPFSVEDKLRQAGAFYVKAKREGKPFAVRSGNIVTGQNSESVVRVSELIVEGLSMGVRMTP
ncbi:hypothetical protein WJX72_002815 [[Myrmecia] bisecta]|uniref:Uncharacterized protein n=1 Tax=[Myrmecia] bisecta TaxID=41462 RepID=A0AAW1PCW3_9CHLO